MIVLCCCSRSVDLGAGYLIRSIHSCYSGVTSASKPQIIPRIFDFSTATSAQHSTTTATQTGDNDDDTIMTSSMSSPSPLSRSPLLDGACWLALGVTLGSVLTWKAAHLSLLAKYLRPCDKDDDHDNDSLSYEQRKRERLPDLVILVRHGESEGNIDKTMWWKKPDNQISLTKKGRDQATAVGKRIERVFQHYEQSLGLSMQRVHIHASPFVRTIQTAKLARSSFEHRVVRQNSCPRLREQEFGNTQSADFQRYRQEQKRVGRFWYRFPTGESGADGESGWRLL